MQAESDRTEHPSEHEMDAYCEATASDALTLSIEAQVNECSECALKVVKTVQRLTRPDRHNPSG